MAVISTTTGIRDVSLPSDVLTAYNRIPYGLIEKEFEGQSRDIISEYTEIMEYYDVYKKGAGFLVEGSNGDYLPAQLRYKMSASLINKEARFLFAEPPDVIVEPRSSGEKVTDAVAVEVGRIDQLVRAVLAENNFEQSIVKAAKDCFIGRRVAALANFNEEDGITVTFLPATQFVYETKPGNPNVITKFVSFSIIHESKENSKRRIFKKRYTLEGDEVYLEETIHDGIGNQLEEVTPLVATLLERIPAVVIVNDGLTGDEKGESEIDNLAAYESWYSKLSNSDIDAERKSMNPIRYTIDMEPNSTKILSSSAGSYWDLQSDQNLPDPRPGVGMLESSMAYSESLKTSLDRIKTSGYEQVDMPNVSLESMKGTVTSGKALKSIYWPLIVRCKEKMKSWGPQLENLVHIIIDGAFAYPSCAEKYTSQPIAPIEYEVQIVQNTPLPEDEIEDKQIDLAEVESKTMSKKAYMKKWRGLTDEEVESELQQIALERQILEDSTFSGSEFDGGNNAAPFGSVGSPETSGSSRW